MPRLIVTDGNGAVTEHEIARGSASIGRSSKCDVVVLESEASRRHAVVEYDGERLLLRDQASHNGTWLNGERVAAGPHGQAELSHGDEIRIGAAILKVVMEGPAGAGGAVSADEQAAGPASAAASEPAPEPVRSAAKSGRSSGEAPSPPRPDARHGRVKPELARREAGPRPTGGAEEESARGTEEPTKEELAWKVGDQEVVEEQEAEEEAKEKQEKKAAKKRLSRRKTARQAVDRAAPAGSEPARITRRKRVVFGGRRLSQQQQTIVKIASFAVMVLCIIVGAWLLSTHYGRPVKKGQRRVVDPRAEPELLAEQAGALARQARAAEYAGNIREGFRLIGEAKEKIEEADRLYSELARQYQDKGRWRGQIKARQIKTQAQGIREQHFRLDMQVRREEGRF